MPASATPVIFIHGLWIHSTAWQAWVDYFNAAGYAATAPGWPGDSDTVEATRATPDAVADKGIDDVTEHYAEIIRGLARGGFYEFHGRHYDVPSIKLCPVPAKPVPILIGGHAEAALKRLLRVWPLYGVVHYR